MIFITQGPLVDHNQKALNKMSIIAEIKVAVEDAVWVKHTTNVQFFKSKTVKIEGILKKINWTSVLIISCNWSTLRAWILFLKSEQNSYF